MKKLILYFSLLIPVVTQSQDMTNSIGIITISNNYDNTDRKIEFLNEDGTTWYSLDLYISELQNNSDFKIIAFKPDYSLFKIRCKEKTSDSFTVIVNEETGLTKKIENTNKVQFVTWEEYVLDVFSIGFDPSKVLIYNSINGDTLKELPKKESIIIPREVKGEWMRIDRTKPGDYSFDSANMHHGWIRWKENNRILISIYHLS